MLYKLFCCITLGERKLQSAGLQYIYEITFQVENLLCNPLQIFVINPLAKQVTGMCGVDLFLGVH